MTLRRYYMSGPLLLMALLIACDRADPLEPRIQAAAAAGSGSTLNAPSGTNALAVSPSRIDVSWQDNSTNESGFEVHRSTTGASGAFTLRATTGAGVTSYGDAGLTPLTAYCYQVRAFRKTGNKNSYSAFSSAACATTPAPPPPPGLFAPSSTNATPLNAGAISITWTDNSDNEQSFRVERSPAPEGPWTVITSVGINGTSLVVGERAEQVVCYRVIAVNPQGESPSSNVDCTALPMVPIDLTATFDGATGVDLAWSDNSTLEDGYEVQRGGTDHVYSAIAQLPADATGYRDAGVVPDSTYVYRVVPRKDGGHAGYSNWVSVVTATTLPSAPSDAAASPLSSSSVSVFWRAGSQNTDGFRVERSTDGGASWTTVATRDAYYGIGLGDSLLVSEQEVCYQVFAVNRIGESPPSNQDCTTPPAGPTGLMATAVDEGTIELTWTDNSAVEDGYEVWYCDAYSLGCELVLVASLPADTTSLRVAAGYQYYVVAIKDGGYSDWSNSAP